MAYRENNSEIFADVVGSKKNTGRVIAALAALLVGGSALAYLRVPVFRNTVRMTFMKPEKYCASVYQKSFDSVSYDVENSELADSNAVDLTLKADLDDEMMDGLKGMLGSSLFDSAEISVNVLQSGDREKAVMSAKADSRHVLSLEAVKDGTKCFFRLPEAGEKYLSYDLAENYKAFSSGSEAAELSSDDMGDIVRRYSSIAVEYISESDSIIEKGFKGEVEGVPYKYNRIITEITPEDMKEIAGRISDEMQADSRLQEIFTGDDYDEAVENVRHYFDDSMCESCSLVTYVDARGDIRGASFSVDDTEKAGFITAKSGNNIAVKASADSCSVVVTAAEQDEKYTGEFKLNTDDSDMVFSFEDFYVIDEKFISGVISADMSEITDENISTLSLLFEKDGDAQKISTDINDFGNISVLYRNYTEPAADIQVPADSIDISNADQYLSEINTAELITKLCTALGIDERAVSGLLWRFM